MGSRIGDYIHYHTYNYLKYGTNRVEKSMSFAMAAEQQRASIERAIKTAKAQGIDANDKRKLKHILNTFMKPLQDASQYHEGESAAEYEEIWEILLEYFQSEFNIATEAIMRDTLNVLPNPIALNSVTSKIQPRLRDTTTKKAQQTMKASTIQKRLIAIQNFINTVNTGRTSGVFSEKQLALIKASYGEVITEAKNLEKLLQKDLATMAMDTGKTGEIPINDVLSLVNAINKTIMLTNGVANTQKGTLFEYLIAVAPLIGQGLTGETLRRAIAEAIGMAQGPFLIGQTGPMGMATGKSSTSVQFDKNSFLNMSNNQWKNIMGSNYHINDNLVIANAASPDKVDVTLTFTPGKKPINISAKNVNISGKSAKNISLVSSMSLLSAFAHFESHEFVNHYLNIHTTADTLTSVFTKHNMYSISADILNLSILEQAWRGYKETAPKADVFVVNDNMTGEINIFNIGDLLQTILYSNTVNQVCKISPDVANLTIPMAWSPISFNDRIVQVLSAVHGVKLFVSIDPSVLGY